MKRQLKTLEDFKLDYKTCHHFENEKLPLLVLATANHFPFKNSGLYKREWLPIFHQTAGNACHHHYMMGTILKPKPHIQQAMKTISGFWLDSCAGMWGASLDSILTYRSQISDMLKADCNNCYDKFEEGIYPLDTSVEFTRSICTDKIPKEFDQFVDWTSLSKLSHLCGILNRWQLYILGPNCD